MWVQQRDYKVVGAILAEAREKSGLSQDQLAERLSKPQSFVSHYENGQRRIDLLEFIRIMEGLGGDPAEVFKLVLRRQLSGKSRPVKR